MAVRIAVLDPLPVYRHGMMAALGRAVLDSEAPEDLFAWGTEEQQRIVLLTLQGPDDWTLLTRFRQERPDLIVVAVLTDVDVQTYVEAVLAGAVAAVPRDASPETIKRVFEEAVNGASLLPIKVVRALTTRQKLPDVHSRHPVGVPEVQGTGADLSPREVEWLRELADGSTVARLAEKTGYSERAMFRLLRNVYGRMQVRNRTEALIRAHQQGWL